MNILSMNSVRLATTWAKTPILRLTLENVTNTALSAIEFIPIARQTGFFAKGAETLFKAATSDKSHIDFKVEKVFWQVAQGVLLFGAGICGIWSEMEWLVHSTRTPLSTELFYWNNGLFLTASIVGLKLAVDAYEEASLEVDVVTREKLKYRAMIEILMNFSFIVGSVLFITGCANVTAIVICALGSSLSCIQFVLDYYS